ncbi:MAG TPA: HD domain-containing protein [Candidatus Methanoculleus thermohydrogenotrophicum]|jgi:dGTPase|nr:HD domain-containing protein [Candidatus Methanoculleus thermohydrogenotrophicum]NLM82829.1 HD domain-containing protein [Candidatus Methanoculleus thermohydrogenotrophicum]HOB18298.1 HD domain-containing protein [Candidatus Methanoculleus thermohydrogenotrophicum]HPZ38057.1 HD domain-containing protein [Candidatus Methanoculleus thermohydrogenotrophicum]HQC91512.1 HD domain-containing protein [Candidatus Methanoculleus thermohydrogenotrophicum]
MQIPPETLDQMARRMADRELLLSPRATRDAGYLRRSGHKPEEPAIRPPFSRDADRIIHSKAYSRYIDKTQVFYLVENDHITHRVLHVQLASKIARTVGRALGLNEDLIEAIALGHDIGHAPYGHLGEEILDSLCRDHGVGGFMHNVQSVRFLEGVEDCDLTLQVLDGILCHNGEVHTRSLRVEGEADWDSFAEKLRRIEGRGDALPFTSEGCVVRCADSISYLGRDLQDALEVEIIDDRDLEEFPENCMELFGITGRGKKAFREINRRVLDVLIRDIIASSYDSDCIALSDEASASVAAFKDFNIHHIYKNGKLRKNEEKIRVMFRYLFDQILEDIEGEHEDSPVYVELINAPWVSRRYIDAAAPAELARDFIAGMTDRYFEQIFRQYILPERVHSRYQGW